MSDYLLDIIFTEISISYDKCEWFLEKYKHPKLIDTITLNLNCDVNINIKNLIRYENLKRLNLVKFSSLKIHDLINVLSKYDHKLYVNFIDSTLLAIDYILIEKYCIQ